MLTNRDVILVKVESTYNTDASPVAGDDAVLVEQPSWGYEGARMLERPAIRQSLAKLQQVYGGALKTVSFTVELKGAGSAYSASNLPEIDALLRACALSSTVDATGGSETVTYEPVSDSDSHESVTVYYYQDGTLHALTGCRGTVDFNFIAGGVVKANFNLIGHFAGLTDSSLPSPTYSSVVPPVFKGASFQVGGYSAVINALTVDLGLQTAMPPDANASDGYGEIRIIGRDVNGSFDPEHTLKATKDWLGIFEGGTTEALQTGDIGATQYNQISLSHPGIYYREPSPGDRDGVRTLEVPYGALESGTDDEFSLVFK